MSNKYDNYLNIYKTDLQRNTKNVQTNTIKKSLEIRQILIQIRQTFKEIWQTVKELQHFLQNTTIFQAQLLDKYDEWSKKDFIIKLQCTFCTHGDQNIYHLLVRCNSINKSSFPKWLHWWHIQYIPQYLMTNVYSFNGSRFVVNLWVYYKPCELWQLIAFRGGTSLLSLQSKRKSYRVFNM